MSHDHPWICFKCVAPDHHKFVIIKAPHGLERQAICISSKMVDSIVTCQYCYLSMWNPKYIQLMYMTVGWFVVVLDILRNLLSHGPAPPYLSTWNPKYIQLMYMTVGWFVVSHGYTEWSTSSWLSRFTPPDTLITACTSYCAEVYDKMGWALILNGQSILHGNHS